MDLQAPHDWVAVPAGPPPTPGCGSSGPVLGDASLYLPAGIILRLRGRAVSQNQ